MMDSLDALAKHTCHIVLGDVVGMAIKCRPIWDAWHAVQRCYRNPLSPAREQGANTVLGFSEQVGGEIELRNSCLSRGYTLPRARGSWD